MARIRTIKPEFFTSLTIADLTPEQRLTFIGLWTNVDDEGRCVDDPRLIKAAIWPLDDRTAADIEDDLRALSESSLITRYVFKQKRYMAVNGWREHQKINRPTPSKLPAPEQGEIPAPEPSTCEDSGTVSTHAHLTEDSLGERKGKEQGKERKGKEPPASRPPRGGRRTRGTRLPDDFPVTAAMAAWARENTPRCGTDDHESFCDYWRSVAGTKGVKVDWVATWRNWMRTEQKKHTTPRPAASRRPTSDDRLAEIQALKQEAPGNDRALNIVRGEIA